MTWAALQYQSTSLFTRMSAISRSNQPRSSTAEAKGNLESSVVFDTASPPMAAQFLTAKPAELRLFYSGDDSQTVDGKG